MVESRNYEVIFFDLGNTLLYFDGDWSEVNQQSVYEMVNALHTLGYPVDTEDFSAAFQQSMQEYHLQRERDHLEFSSEYVLRCLLHRYGFDLVPRDHLRTALDHLYAVTEANWLIEEDTIPTLNELLKCGYRLGIISNAADDHDVQMLIDQHNLRSFFSVILVSAAMGIRKPHPRIFQHALDFFEIPPRKAIMVGDTLNADILGAINIGMDCVWITRRANTSDNRILKDSIHPSATISKLSELPDIIQHILSHPGNQTTTT